MIKKLNNLEIEKLYKEHIAEDFNLESPPCKELVRLAEHNCVDVLSFRQDGVEKGYAICMEKGDYMALLFFAAYKGLRGQGLGTQFIGELREYYAYKEVIVEVESLDNSDEDEEQNIIKRRISFYENIGFMMLPNVKEVLNGFIYHIMTLPGQRQSMRKDEEVVDEVIELLESVYNGNLAGFVKKFQIKYQTVNQ